MLFEVSSGVLNAMLHPKDPLTDDAVVMMNDAIAGLSVRREKDGSLRVTMLMLLEGGVTEEWLVGSVGYWVGSVRRLERMVRRLEATRPPAPQERTRVH